VNERLLVIGATSAIATGVARRYAARKARIGLIGRRADALDSLAADLRVRGAAEVEIWVLDANDIARHADCLDAAWHRFDGFDHVLVAHGVLPDQTECDNRRRAYKIEKKSPDQCTSGVRVAANDKSRSSRQDPEIVTDQAQVQIQEQGITLARVV